MTMSTRPQWSSRTKLTVVLLLLGLGVYLLYQFREAIQPMVLALVLAYVLSPVVGWLQRRLNIRRALAAGLAYLALLATMAVVPLVVVPPLAAQTSSLNVDLQRYLAEAEAFLGRRYHVAGQTIDMEAAFQQVAGSVQGLVEPVFGRTIEVAFQAISSLVWVIFILVVAFYLIKDGDKLRRWVEDLVPAAYLGDFLILRNEINGIWSAFFRGQLALAGIVTVVFTVVGLIIGLPFTLPMAMLAGLLEFLPSVGHAIWLSIASLLALYAGSTWLPLPHWAFFLLLVGMHVFFQQFDLNYLIPRVIGRRVHLPPLVVILGIVTGALLAGVLGILLAAPTIASARVLGRYVYANLFDQDPFPVPVASPLPPPNPLWWRKTGFEGKETAEQSEEWK